MRYRILLSFLLTMLFVLASGCGTVKNCPTCGTTVADGYAIIDVIPVPGANPTGEPGGPFNIFDISWVDSTNHLFYVSDRVHLDIPIMSTTNNIAVAAIGGDNSVAEAGNNASLCLDTLKVPTDPTTIPPITSAQGNYTRFGCKTMGFSLAGGFGANGHFGGFMGGQCCASRANNLNPLSGPNGLEVTADGTFLFAGTGSSNVVVFDLTATLANPASPPTVVATIPTGTTPDYDGIPDSTTNCAQFANGRAFGDPTCGDLRADELSTGIATDAAGNQHFLVLAANGDPGFPFVTIIDATNLVNRTGTQTQQHCLPVNPSLPYSPGGRFTTFAQNLPAPFPTGCILGQIYWDGSPANDTTVVVDDAGSNAGIPCPNPSLTFADKVTPVPSGVSGHNAGGPGVDVPCHRGPFIASFGTTAISPAGIGGSVFNPKTGHFLVTNANASSDVTLGTIDEIDPLHTVAGFPNPVPVVVNSFPVVGCMPSGVLIGPGTDILVTCENHDGRTFPPSEIIMNGTNGQILATIPFVGGVDEGWYNPGDNRYYLAARDMPTGPVLGVVDAKSRQWLQNVPANSNSHSVAVDKTNNHVFVPLAAGPLCGTQRGNGCVGVYAQQ